MYDPIKVVSDFAGAARTMPDRIYKIASSGELKIDKPKVSPQGAASGTMQVNFQDLQIRCCRAGVRLWLAGIGVQWF